ncbi:MAG: hypothetical protein ACXWC2_18095 [Ramlibacter sp.]
MECITGPHHGFYIASYASESGAPSEGFLGYAKVCRRRPESYWDANCLVKICGEGLHADPQRAIQEVQQRALEQLDDLVPATATAVA